MNVPFYVVVIAPTHTILDRNKNSTGIRVKHDDKINIIDMKDNCKAEIETAIHSWNFGLFGF